MVGIKIWNDVIKVVNQVRAEYYKKEREKPNGSKYTSANAMKDAWKSQKVLDARAEYDKFKKDHPDEWKRKNDEYLQNKKPRKTKKSK